MNLLYVFMLQIYSKRLSLDSTSRYYSYIHNFTTYFPKFSFSITVFNEVFGTKCYRRIFSELYVMCLSTTSLVLTALKCKICVGLLASCHGCCLQLQCLEVNPIQTKYKITEI